MDWTKEQEQAIYAHGGTVLVSAAAGSGKTAVLVERVVEMICNSEHPCPIDRMLIVTYTKAAAGEMRERIGNALDERIQKDPQNQYLLKQKLLLASAQICTIDSFSATIVRNYYNELNISPDFSVLDDSEQHVLEDESLTECLLPLYENKSEAFLNLSHLFLLGGSDSNLKTVILNLYHYAQAYPFPKKWLENIPKLYLSSVPIEDTPWAQKIFAYVEELAQDNRELGQAALKMMEDDIPLLNAYGPALESDMQFNEKIFSLCQEQNWQALKEHLDSFKPVTLKGAPQQYSDSYLKTTVKSLRDSEKDTLKNLVEFLPVTSEEYKADCQVLEPVISLLIDTVLSFSDILFAKKKEKNSFDFSDIAHMALNLCVEITDSEQIQKTKIAKELSNLYDEILLDEYQDTNEAQDMLFSAISKDEKNMFMVGDVKQSIYGFRRAMPEIFLNRRKNSSAYDGEHFPSRIDLNANFRSRKTVAGSINVIFSKIMNEKIGGVNYDSLEQLNPQGNFGDTDDFPLELDLIENNDLDGCGRLPEAQFIAKRIRNMIDSEMPVTLKNQTQRPIQYSDICILMRSVTSGEKYKEALEEEGIPTFFQQKGGFFSMREIQFMTSLLKILDNPFQDVPLCACLVSPIWAFTPDDLAKLKTEFPSDSLFRRLYKTDLPKAKQFLKEFKELKQLSTTLSVSALLRVLYEKTGYFAIVGALSGGENRKLNLQLLLQYAYDYEKSGQTGLAGFVRYLQKLEINQSSIESATGVSSYANVVRIMTVHKSKGLEFPVVILAKCGSPLNTSDQKQKMLLHNQMKIGIKVPDRKNQRVLDSLPYLATKLSLSEEEKAEELRVLYVALTRAREKLIIVGSGSKRRKLKGLIQSAALASLYSSMVPTYFIRKANTYLDLIIAALIKQKDAQELYDLADVPVVQKDDFQLPIEVHLYDGDFFDEEIANEQSNTIPDVNMVLLHEIKKKVEYSYPRMPLAFCPAKASASALNEKATEFDFFAAAKPAFIGKGKLTPAMRGSLMHRFMEKCDFLNAKSDLEKEISRLEDAGLFESEEAKVLDRAALQGFLSSNLFERMLKADHIYKEQKFTVFFPATEVYSELDSSFQNEDILIQGVIDCAFEENGEIVIVDYKTDHEKDIIKLKNQYQKQLAIYKKAATEIFNKEISQTLLYSFYLKQEISLNL